MNNPKKFWNWISPARDEEQAARERTLEIYGTIASETWMDDDVTPKMFHDELFSGGGPVTIWLSSPGGDVVAASQIYSMLLDYPDDVTVKIDGLAASAASVIAMAGTKVLMAPTSLLMIHDPLATIYGNKEAMQKGIEMLDEVKDSILNAYEIKTGLSRAKLSHMMEEETWLSAGKAIELGFADGLLQDRKTDEEPLDYSFSNKAAEVSFWDKLRVKCKEDSGSDAKPVPDPGNAEHTIRLVVETQPAPEAKIPKQRIETGTPVIELEKRLNLLK